MNFRVNNGSAADVNAAPAARWFDPKLYRVDVVREPGGGLAWSDAEAHKTLSFS